MFECKAPMKQPKTADEKAGKDGGKKGKKGKGESKDGKGQPQVKQLTTEDAASSSSDTRTLKKDDSERV